MDGGDHKSQRPSRQLSAADFLSMRNMDLDCLGGKRTEKDNGNKNVTLTGCNRLADAVNDFDDMTKGRGQKVAVELCVIFLKVGEINTLKEKFSADILIKARWREPELDGVNAESDNGISFEWNHLWNPRLYVENTIGDTKESRTRYLIFDEDGLAFMCEKIRVKGEFVENLELKDFPFDVQDLTVTISSEHLASDIELMDDHRELHVVQKQSFVDEQEWYLYKHIQTEVLFTHTYNTEFNIRNLAAQTIPKRILENTEDPFQVKKTCMKAKCRAARRFQFFLYNSYLLCLLICSLSFATFSVRLTLPQNRLQLTFTLVLTSVAFKFVVNQSLPTVSYLTYLDKYLLGSMFLLVSVCVWHAVVSAIPNENEAQIAETVVVSFLALAYAVFNAAIVAHIYYYACSRRRLMEEKDKHYFVSLIKTTVNARHSCNQIVHIQLLTDGNGEEGYS